MSGVVAFDYTSWATRYPELACSVLPPLALAYWTEAQLYCDNTACSPISDLTVRAMLLNMVCSHIAALNAPLNGQPSSPLVGRVSSASEGSVSVQTSMDVAPGTAQWFAQSKYGASFWAATAQYRTMHYMPNPGRPTDPYAPLAYFSRFP